MLLFIAMKMMWIAMVKLIVTIMVLNYCDENNGVDKDFNKLVILVMIMMIMVILMITV